MSASTAPLPSHIDHCAFSSWYPRFKSITIKSHIIPLSEEFVAYLNADGVFLPESTIPAPDRNGNDSEEYDTDEWRSRPDEPSDGDADLAPQFPELEERIVAAIEDLDGRVFPKLNWSAPKDATWISPTGTLMCTSPGDVFLLLKSSDFVSHDLGHAYDDCTEGARPQRPAAFELVLRRWTDITTSTEFRCFVKGHRLVGISQRDCNNRYPFIIEQQNDIREAIARFFDANIRGRFPDDAFVFDVYLTSLTRTRLLDINPWAPSTDALGFTWSELDEMQVEAQDLNTPTDASTVIMRVVESGIMQPAAHLSYRLPRDVIGLACGEDIETFADRFRAGDFGQRNAAGDDSDSDLEK